MKSYDCTIHHSSSYLLSGGLGDFGRSVGNPERINPPAGVFCRCGVRTLVFCRRPLGAATGFHGDAAGFQQFFL